MHGWHSSRLVKSDGELYCSALVDNPESGEGFKFTTLFLRREPDGSWTEIGSYPHAAYSMYAAPGGYFYVLSSWNYNNTRVLRTRQPWDFSEFDQLYEDLRAYSYQGMGVSVEGNWLLLHSENMWSEYLRANADETIFYEAASGCLHQDRVEYPEGNYGYEGVLLDGKEALVVAQSAIRDPEHHPTGYPYSWRHLRLLYNPDLTQEAWQNQGWLLPEWGATALKDFVRGPDGEAYLAYYHQSADSLETMETTPGEEFIARIHRDLTADVFPLDFAVVKLLVSGCGRWYALTQSVGEDLQLWELDPAAGFAPVNKYLLPDTARLMRYALHTLHPERHGGEDDGNTVHLLTTEVPEEDPAPPTVKYWHVYFDLPE
jgi:hypothetical protein